MRILALFALLLVLTACNKPPSHDLFVGTIAGPESELVEVAQKVAEERFGLRVKIIEFSDYNLPNEALQDGSLDANIYQHLPYLKAASKAHGYRFKVLGKTFVYPAGIYSKTFKSLKDIPNKALIALPNDPSNEARALMLLQKAGLIQLKKTRNATVQDISKNPKNLRFKEMDAAQLVRILDDVDVAVINTNFAIPAGLSPSRDALFAESKQSPYANIIVVRENSDKKALLQSFLIAMQSLEVEDKARELFGDAAIKAW